MLYAPVFIDLFNYDEDFFEIRKIHIRFDEYLLKNQIPFYLADFNNRPDWNSLGIPPTQPRRYYSISLSYEATGFDKTQPKTLPIQPRYDSLDPCGLNQCTYPRTH